MTTRQLAVDFHVHTPLSRCHELEPWSPDEFLQAAVNARLDAVVVTDHHTTVNAWQLLDASDGDGIQILPGMELTTRDGHLLVMFDPSRGASASRALLEEVGLPESEQGNGSFVLQIPMLDVVVAASALGAFCIPAHIDRWPNGFLERQISFRTREAIVGSPLLSAFEITLPATQPQWESGTMPPFNRPVACVRGSDAHGLKEVGRRPTWISAEAATFEGIVSALAKPGATTLQRPCEPGVQ